MAAFHRLASSIERRGVSGTVPWGDATPPTAGTVGSMGGNSIAVSEQSALGVAAVYACVGVLADGLGTLPLRQYKGDPLAIKAAVPMDPSPIVLQPWSEFQLVDFLSSGQVGLALNGNNIGQIVDRDRRGFATQIMPLDPNQVRVKRDSDGYLEYRIQGGGGNNAKIPTGDVFHIRNLMRPGGVVGMNPIQVLRTELQLAIAAPAYAARFFTNSALPLGILTTEEDLTDDVVLDVQRRWTQMHGGINGAHMPAVLSGGLEWHQVSMNLEDLQFIESQQLTTEHVAMIFRVPPHMISQVDRTTSWGTGVEQQFLGFVRFTLGSYLRRWESAMSALLPRGQFVKFDLRQLLRPDSVQRAAVIVALRNAGILSANEARDFYEDLGPIPNGDVYLQPLNMGQAGVPPVVSTPTGSKAAGDYGYEERNNTLEFLRFCGVESRTELLDLLHGEAPLSA